MKTNHTFIKEDKEVSESKTLGSIMINRKPKKSYRLYAIGQTNSKARQVARKITHNN